MREPASLMIIVAIVIAGCATPAPSTTMRLHEALLWQSAPQVQIELHHAPGTSWDNESLPPVYAAIENVTAKEVITNGSFPLRGPVHRFESDFVWGAADLNALMMENDFGTGGPYRPGERPVVHFVLLNGRSEASGGGLQIGSVVITHFGTARASHPNLTLTRAEAAVLIHEFGHVVGLVNKSIPMVHARETADGNRHSTSPLSVMYAGPRTDVWNLTARELQSVIDSRPLGFDAYDWEDIRAFQARDPFRKPPTVDT